MKKIFIGMALLAYSSQTLAVQDGVEKNTNSEEIVLKEEITLNKLIENFKIKENQFLLRKELKKLCESKDDNDRKTAVDFLKHCIIQGGKNIFDEIQGLMDSIDMSETKLILTDVLFSLLSEDSEGAKNLFNTFCKQNGWTWKEIAINVLSSLILKENKWGQNQLYNLSKSQNDYEKTVGIQTFAKILIEDNVWAKNQITKMSQSNYEPDSNIAIKNLTQVMISTNNENEWAKNKIIVFCESDKAYVRVLGDEIFFNLFLNGHGEWAAKKIFEMTQTDPELWIENKITKLSKSNIDCERNLAIRMLQILIEANDYLIFDELCKSNDANTRHTAAKVLFECIQKNVTQATYKLNELKKSEDENEKKTAQEVELFIYFSEKMTNLNPNTMPFGGVDF
jgi:hypothetical protein